MPIVVGDFVERLWLVHAEIIDKDVYVGHSFDAFRASVRCCQIGSYAADFGVADFSLNPFERVINPVLGAAGNNNGRSFARQSVSNGKADPRRRARDQRFLSIQLQIHGVSLLLLNHRVVTMALLRLRCKRGR